MPQCMQTDLTIEIDGHETVYACTVTYQFHRGYKQTWTEPGEEDRCEVLSVTGRLVQRKWDSARKAYVTSVPANAPEIDFTHLLSDEAIEGLGNTCLSHYEDACEYAREVAADAKRDLVTSRHAG